MAAITSCRANVGTRTKPRQCGKPVAKGMLAACAAHRTAMIPTGTAGIFYRGGRYVAVTYHGNKKQHKTFHRKLSEAREARGDRTGTDRSTPRNKTPFEEYARDWIDHYPGRTARGFDADTRAAYRAALETHIIPYLGRKPLREIGRQDIDKLVSKLQSKGLAAATISKYVAPLRAMFSDAVDREHMSTNPALRLRINAKAARPERPVAAREKALAIAEVLAILYAVPEHYRLLFELLAGTGCRISEALGLDWADLRSDGDRTTLRIERQWYRGTLKPNAKTEAGERTIDLDAVLAAKLWAAGGDATGPMFTTRDGNRLNDRNLRRVLDAVTQPRHQPDGTTSPAPAGPGLESVSFHTFRHTHGSILIDDGWTIPEVSERLGHADPAITARVYSHKLRDRRRAVPSLNPDIPHEEAAAGNGQRLGNA